MATERVTTYGPGGYDPAKPAKNVVEERDVEIPPQDANRSTLRDRAGQALATNAAYLALTNPTAAQNTAHLRAVTRECNALIRLLLERLNDVSDT
jgi:hypothetical protein